MSGYAAVVRTWWALIGALVAACSSSPRVRPIPTRSDGDRATNLSIRLVFDTGPKWWTDPDEECPAWSQALPLARGIAGCSEDYVGDPTQRCQAAIRKCSTGCDVCRNLKPGQGPDTDFGRVRQPPDGVSYAATDGPYLLGGYDTRFDRAHVCADAKWLADVMIHEATHACRAAGGDKDLYDEKDFFDRGTPGCYAGDVAPFEGGRRCGDSP